MAANPLPVYGRPPTAADQVWIEARKEVAPAKSLARIQEHAKYLFTLVASLSTLLTGLGVVTAGSLPHPGWVILPLALVCASLALAMYALTPRVSSVAVDNLASVRTHYSSAIRGRGNALFLAGLLFALALLSFAAVFPLLTKKAPPVQPVIAAHPVMKLSGIPGNRCVTAEVALSGLPHGTWTEVHLAGLKAEGQRWVPLASQVAYGSAEGKVEVQLASTASYRDLRMTIVATQAGKRLYQQEFRIDP